MSDLRHLLDANRSWSERLREQDPAFFPRLGAQQSPELLWIGCSDSRLPPDRILDRDPGSIFVHRNVGNVVVHTDLNCLTVLQYGIQVLEIRDVIVCGHYGCGAIRAACDPRPMGLIDNWIHNVRDVREKHRAELGAIRDEETRGNRLCELNVVEQVFHVALTTIVRHAWRAGRDLTVHGWIYSVSDGRLRDLGVSVSSARALDDYL